MSRLPTPAWRGRVVYERALKEQRRRREGVLEGAPEAFWLLEHPAVLTAGRRSVQQVPSSEWLRARGLRVVPTERGGLLTWHGPGQLVGYLIVDLGRLGLGSRRFVHAVEQGLIDWLQTVDVAAGRRDGLHGVWSTGGKIASIGLHIRHHVTLHGFSLNLDPDLSVFDGFTACGVIGGKTTSVREQTGRLWTPQDASRAVGQAVCSAIQRASVDT